MSYEIEYHPLVKEDISKFPANIKSRIKKAIESRILNDPFHYGEPLRKSLLGFRKLRIGDYRVIYKVVDTKITVLKVGHRKEVYEDFDRR